MSNFEVFDANGNGNSIREWVINCLKIILVRKTLPSNATERKIKNVGRNVLDDPPNQNAARILRNPHIVHIGGSDQVFVASACNAAALQKKRNRDFKAPARKAPCKDRRSGSTRTASAFQRVIHTIDASEYRRTPV